MTPSTGPAYLAHWVVKTARTREMIDWYGLVFGAQSCEWPRTNGINASAERPRASINSPMRSSYRRLPLLASMIWPVIASAAARIALYVCCRGDGR